MRGVPLTVSAIDDMKGSVAWRPDPDYVHGTNRWLRRPRRSGVISPPAEARLRFAGSAGHLPEAFIGEILCVPFLDGLQHEAGDELGRVAIGVIG